ncbi:MAG: MFS transporter [Elusimicrobia bacterium]|nr:MFS transporter [Elusimicrobiota bacterium]
MTSKPSVAPAAKKQGRLRRGVGMTNEEMRHVGGLSGIFALRLLGLFLVLPVLSIYALGLRGATPFLAGLAVGFYGLAQTGMQLPFGMLSDRFGRKPVIVAGLLIYVVGSVVAALSHGIYGLLLGRFMQGMGAIASVLLALIADLTREEVRGRAMAFVGISIGLSFTLGFVLGPILAARHGVPFLFWILAGLDSFAVFYLLTFIPTCPPKRAAAVKLKDLGVDLGDRNLVCLDGVMFLLHLGLTAIWVVTPAILLQHWDRHDIWRVYLPMILLAGFIMLPAMGFAEAKQRLRTLLAAGLLLAGAGFLILALAPGRPLAAAGGLIVYFIGFNLMEPCLPSLVSRFAPEDLRGSAMGLFNMSQFMGAFCGGALGGFALGHGRYVLYWMLLAACLPWAWLASRVEAPPRRKPAQDLEADIAAA